MEKHFMKFKIRAFVAQESKCPPQFPFLQAISGLAMKDVMITGHSQIDTLRRYANIRPRILAENLDGKALSTDFRGKL